MAVNEDGRIGYSDFGNGEDVPGYAYIVNNGGTFDFLLSESSCDYGSTVVDGVNENAEAIGYTVCDGTGNYIGWSLSGDVYSTILYFDQTYPISYANAINDHEIAVGCIGSCYSGAPGSAVIIEASSTSNGRVISLRGIKGRTCSSTASSINDAGTIVGSACDEAVRFYKSGYAQPLGLGRGSTAEAVNQHGDVVGSVGSSAFLERDGITMLLPKPASYGKYSATAYALDATDEVVGDLFGPNDAEVPYLYTRGRAYALNSLLPPHSGWTIVDALGVNDHGEIVGDGYYDGTLYGVSLKPPQ